MKKILKGLKSKTFWTAVLMFILGGLQATTEFLPTRAFIAAEGILTFLVGYFKTHPSQEY